MTQKERVLAESMTETNESNLAFHNDLDWSLHRHEDDEFILEGYGGSVSCAYSEKDAEDSPVWPVAAQILGIGEEETPSNDLLWEAWKEAAHAADWSQRVRKRETERFNEWLAGMEVQNG